MSKALKITLGVIIILSGFAIWFYFFYEPTEELTTQEMMAKITQVPYMKLMENCNYDNGQMQTCCVASVYNMQQMKGFLSDSKLCDGNEIMNEDCPGAYSWCIPKKSTLEETTTPDNQQKSCDVDSDCVRATCCHATEVVNKDFAPDCTEIDCTMSCETVLDCGQSEPVCDDGSCVIDIK